MITAATLTIFAKLLNKYEKKWAEGKSKEHWEKFDYYENIRNDLGVMDGNVEVIPRKKHTKKYTPSRRKHRY